MGTAFCQICKENKEMEPKQYEILWPLSCGHIVDIVYGDCFKAAEDKETILSKIISRQINDNRQVAAQLGEAVSKIITQLSGPRVTLITYSPATKTPLNALR